MSPIHPPAETAIRAALRHRRPQVLWLLFRDEPEGTRLARVDAALRASQKGTEPLDDLLEACRGRAIVGATWAQVMPGHTALVWPPRLVDGEDESTAYDLLGELDRRLQQQVVRVAQAPLQSMDGADASRLIQHGYHHAADLLYLLSMHESFPIMEPVSPLCFEVFRVSESERLGHLIEVTYRDTLDIPALDGVRDTTDVLAGYRSTGEYDPRHWFIATRQSQDVGCLLLSDHPRHQQMELVYMGLIPEARGNRWGLTITRQAQWIARVAGRTKLVLAVDAANSPAVASYARSGFVEWERRHVFLRVYPASCF
ncbi:MAG: GNAT family N-acetyltransferase [Pirellulaceae bacterium]